jgi:integrase
MPLTQTEIQHAKATDKPRKLFDGDGLFLLVSPNGGKWWRFRYRFDGKEKSLSFGVYPEVSLKRARELRENARRLVASMIDPSIERQAKKAAREITFEGVAREWLSLQQSRLAPITLSKARWMLETFIFPDLGSRPISEITPPDLLDVLRKIEERGIHETVHRVKQRVGQVFRYGIATRKAARDITQDLRGALAPVVTQNYPAIIDPQGIAQLLRAIDGYQGQPVTAAALKLAPLLFVRPGELRAAEWKEFDLDRAEWRISAERTKMRRPHVVPLCAQALQLLRDLQPLTGEGRYVFPSLRSYARPMSENTVNAALRRLGYTGDEMTGHGFRALASTCLNEQGFAPDVIELQLAHKERNKVRAAYNRAERLAERVKMMQAWADYLDGLRASDNVVPIKRSA